MTAGGRTVVAELHERGEARQAYDQAIAAGQRASIAEEERPDVFTMRVGNIAPGERVEVALTLTGPLPFEDGEATFRFPLVVAPRYIAGPPADRRAGRRRLAAPDTDAVPDASRITPPVLLPGLPEPGSRSSHRASRSTRPGSAGASLPACTRSLHTVGGDGAVTVALHPGERLDRDFVLRFGCRRREVTAAIAVVTARTRTTGRPGRSSSPWCRRRPGRRGRASRDVVLLLDRSGSMGGWKMVAARRAAARIVDTLGARDRFAVLAFDHVVERPTGCRPGSRRPPTGTASAAVEHLAGRTPAAAPRCSTPVRAAATLLACAAVARRARAPPDGSGRDRFLVLVTDGQVGNEDQILAAVRRLMPGSGCTPSASTRRSTPGSCGRLAAPARGRCELVESEDRLDEAMTPSTGGSARRW